MKKYYKIIQIVSAMIVLTTLYFIWPLPFQYLSQKVLIPAVSSAVSGLSKAAEPLRTLGRIQNLDDKNKRLEKENNELRAQIIKITEQTNKCRGIINERESALQTELPLKQALVIGKSPFSFNQIFIVNLGFDDGVRQESAVLAGGYLLGKVVDLTNKTATVKLVTDHSSLIPAMTVNSRQSGIVQGGLEGLVLSDIPVDATVEEGEAVVTSGMGGNLPAGIPIGIISRVEQKSGGLFKNIRLQYQVNPTHIEVVSVIYSDEQS